ncbi:acyl-CoA dehydrogenase family protein [Alkaliphilus transvaalensis]|uniref:acyl-CoA dehydrogenase family protein n=1 Tax=Alkaliphilus transvaalensis TaxID=114628 RepID=UPI00047D65FD|nr:acyl-CoA dehydrogenase family protein [Alkaliphilus transvaalensis]
MRIELTDEQIKKKDEFKEFVDTSIIPYAKDNDEEENMNPEMLKKVIESKYLGAPLPKEYGGLDWDQITIGLLNEQFGRGCSSAKGLLTVHGMCSLAILKWGSEEQRNLWLPKMAKGEAIGAFALTEPNIGSDAKSVETVASQVDGHYVINGHKKWITMGQIADIIIVFAKLEGKPTAFLVEKGTPGFSVKPMKKLLGSRAAMIAELTFQDCKIPIENIIGFPGGGITHVALSCLDYGRYTVAWGCVGLAEACLTDSLKYARRRKQFDAPLRKNQLIQKMITEMTVDVEAARQLCYKCGYLKDVGDPDSIVDTWIAKYYAAKMVNRVANNAVQIFGGNGCYNEYPIERYLRDARINEIIEGTTQMHEVLIATNSFVRYS